MNNQNQFDINNKIPESIHRKTKSDDEQIIRKHLIEDAIKKPIKDMIQYDVFFDDFDDVIKSNASDGLSYWSGGNTWELRRTDSIRLQFPTNTDLLIVITALEGLINNLRDEIKKSYYSKDYRHNNPKLS